MKNGLLFVLLPLLLTGGASPGPPLLTLRHTDAVRRVQFGPDGRLLATASADKATLWDTTGQRRHTLQGHRADLWGLSFSPDGSRLATGAADGTLRIWDTRTGRPMRTSTEHFQTILTVAFSPKGDSLATAEFGGDLAAADFCRVKVWDARTGERKAVFRNPGQQFTSLAFSPDGRCLAAGDSGGRVTVWDVARAKAVRTLPGHKGWVRSVGFRPDGRRLAAGHDDGTIVVWEVVTGERSLSLPGRWGPVWRLAWGRDGRRLTSFHWRIGTEPAEVWLWDTVTGQGQLVLGPQDLDGRVHDVALSPDGGRLATAHEDGTVRIWSVKEESGPGVAR